MADVRVIICVCEQQVHSAFYDDHQGVTVEEQMGGSGRDVKAILGTVRSAVVQLKGCLFALKLCSLI